MNEPLRTPRLPHTWLVTAALLAVAAFWFRFLSARDLTNDHYMYLAWAQQILAGDVPGRDFVDPGMPLAYMLSAIVQAVWPGPLSEMVLTIGMLALAAAATCLVVARLSGSLVAGVGAAVIEVALLPRLYSYPKILVPAVALWLLQRYLERPSRGRLTAMALWTVTGGLLRYDLGLYAAAAFAVGLLVARRRAVASYALALCLVLLPYGAFVQWSEGIAGHLRGTVEFAKTESHAFDYGWPAIPAVQAGTLLDWTVPDAAGFLFYVAYATAFVPVWLLIARRRQYSRETAAVVAAAVTLVGWYLVVILRHPIGERIQDLAAVVALAGGWTMAETIRIARGVWERATGDAERGHPGVRRMVMRVGAAACMAVLVSTALGTGASVWVLGNVSERVRTTRVLDGWAKMRERAGTIRDGGAAWPWSRFWPAGELPEAVHFLSECTAPTDRIVLTWSAPEYYYFSRRPFATGHALVMSPNAFTSSWDQNLMVKRLHGTRAPFALINETQREEFARTYPQLDRYIEEHYVSTGTFTIRDGSDITIGLRKDVRPLRTYGEMEWPCLT